jgi:hypothetical protein
MNGYIKQLKNLAIQNEGKHKYKKKTGTTGYRFHIDRVVFSLGSFHWVNNVSGHL